MSNQTEQQSLNRYKIGRHLGEVTLMIEQGADFIQCVDFICNRNGWCFVTNEEWKFLEGFYNYIKG